MKTPTNSFPADRDVTVDELLGGRVRLVQLLGGLRAAIDPVFLAASIPAVAGERVLEVGCGTGAATLCLAARVIGVRIVGFDLQDDLVALARRSATLNGHVDSITFLCGDLLSPPSELSSASFDHVMANPPFARAGSGRVSPDRSKALASVEGAADLAAWVAFCVGRVRPGGSVTFVHRADRVAEVVSLFAQSGLDTTVLPVSDKRVLVQGIRSPGGTVRYLPAFDLHEAIGQFTPAAEAILREGHALTIAR